MVGAPSLSCSRKIWRNTIVSRFFERKRGTLLPTKIENFSRSPPSADRSSKRVFLRARETTPLSRPGLEGLVNLREGR